MALDIGMDIPRTLVSNDVKRINKEAGSDLKKWIAKATCGGEYTRVLDNLAGNIAQRGVAAPAPAINFWHSRSNRKRSTIGRMAPAN